MFGLGELGRKIKGDNEDWKSRDRAMREQMDSDRRMSNHKIDIHVTPYGPGSSISVDGVELPMVHAFSVQAQPDKASRVLVEFVASDVSITGAITKRNMIATDLNLEHARLVVHTPTQDVVQFDDGRFEVVNVTDAASDVAALTPSAERTAFHDAVWKWRTRTR